MYCATEIGLMSITGHILRSRFGMLSKSFRIDIILPPDLIAFWSMPISELFAELPGVGIFADSSAASSLIESVEKLSSTSPKRLMVSSKSVPWNLESTGVRDIVLVTIALLISQSNAPISCSVGTSPFM